MDFLALIEHDSETAMPAMRWGWLHEDTVMHHTEFNGNFEREGRVMDNVIRAQFGDGPAQKLMDEIRAVIMQPAYNELRVCELVGVLTMLTYEMMERNKP